MLELCSSTIPGSAEAYQAVFPVLPLEIPTELNFFSMLILLLLSPTTLVLSDSVSIYSEIEPSVPI